MFLLEIIQADPSESLGQRAMDTTVLALILGIVKNRDVKVTRNGIVASYQIRFSNADMFPGMPGERILALALQYAHFPVRSQLFWIAPNQLGGTIEQYGRIVAPHRRR